METTLNTQKRFFYFSLIVSALLMLFVAFYFEGTGDTGDSITHYLFARYAPSHPALFFDHWAKPVFVLLASPFAQFGFIGIKLFNVFVQLCTMVLLFRIASTIGFKNSNLIGLFYLVAPLNFILTFSGLTEPLFALVLTFFLYLQIVKQKELAAAIVISFLPFVRSEGLIVLAVVGLFYIINRKFKLLPWLIAGHVFFGIAGCWVYGDLFWPITKIPYSNLNSPYGSGSWGHFAEQMVYVIGIPLYALLALGFITVFGNRTYRRNCSLTVLISGTFLAYFLAHTIFWATGSFNSMGLKRVILGVMPCITLLCLAGFNLLQHEKTGKIGRYFSCAFFGLCLAFPILGTPSSIHWKKDLGETEYQKLAREISNEAKKSSNDKTTYWFSAPYLSYSLDIDFFDSTKYQQTNPKKLPLAKSGDVMIWDSHFSSEQTGLDLETAANNLGWRLVSEYRNEEGIIVFGLLKKP